MIEFKFHYPDHQQREIYYYWRPCPGSDPVSRESLVQLWPQSKIRSGMNPFFSCLETFGTNFCMFNVILKIFLEEWFYEKLSWESSRHLCVCTGELPRGGNFSDCLKGLYSKDMFSKDFERGFQLKIHPSDNFFPSLFFAYFSLSRHFDNFKTRKMIFGSAYSQFMLKRTGIPFSPT